MYFPELTIRNTIYPGLRIRSDGLISFKNEPFYPGLKLMHCPKKVKETKLKAKYYYHVPNPRKNFGVGTIRVHALIGHEFCPNPNPDVFDTLDHIFNSLDNRACNLRWVSQKINVMNNNAKNVYYDSREWIYRKGKRPFKRPDNWKRWRSGVNGYPGKSFSTESEAVAYSLVLKRRRFFENYNKHITNHTPTSLYCQHQRPDLMGLTLKDCYEGYEKRISQNLLQR